MILGSEDPLEEEMATYSSILAWEISWTEEPSRLQPIGSQLKQLSMHAEKSRVGTRIAAGVRCSNHKSPVVKDHKVTWHMNKRKESSMIKGYK